MRWTAEQYREYINKGAKSKSKYRSKKTWVDGICFDSKKEAEYYGSLKLLLRAGAIKGFCRQPRFVLTTGSDSGSRATEYVADFIIFDNDNTARIVDTKGMETQEFKLKMKIFREKYPELKVEIE